MKHLTYKYWRKHFIISPTSSLLRINTHHPQRRQLISFKTIAGNGSLRHTDLKNSNKQEKSGFADMAIVKPDKLNNSLYLKHDAATLQHLRLFDTKRVDRNIFASGSMYN